MSLDDSADRHRLTEVDRLIHEPARYNIMALLYVVARAEFLFVQNQTHLTPGNLSSHAGKLETAGFLRIQKEFVGKIPRTYLSLTEPGRAAFGVYRNKMKVLFTTPPPVHQDPDPTTDPA
jgi:hypothetical protein